MPKNVKKIVVPGIIIIAIAISALLIVNKNKSDEKPKAVELKTVTEEGSCSLETESGCDIATEDTDDKAETGNDTSKVKEFNMIAKRFTYEPNTINVNKGDKVKLTVTSEDVPHSFTLPDFGDQSEGGINAFLSPGESVTVEFVADKQGEFVFGCDVACGSGHLKMLGKFIVN